MGPLSPRRTWPLALALASLFGCAEAPPAAPSYARAQAPVPYGYAPYGYAPAYGAMTCSAGPAAYSSAPAYSQPASYSQGPGEISAYSRTPQGYTSRPVFCPVGFGATYSPAYSGAPRIGQATPATWTWPSSGNPASASGSGSGPAPVLLGSQGPSPAAGPAFGSTSGSVTVYTAQGCGPCKNLQHKLNERNIPFQAFDIDQFREAYQRAQVASGGKSGVPLTDINQGQQEVWVLGDDADAVERAYRQN